MNWRRIWKIAVACGLLLLSTRLSADSFLYVAVSHGHGNSLNRGPVTLVEVTLGSNGLGAVQRQVTVGRMFSDQTTLRFYYVVPSLNETTITILEPTGVRTHTIAGTGVAHAVSPDGGELYMSRSSFCLRPCDFRRSALDPITRTERRLVSYPFDAVRDVDVSRDGRRLYVAGFGSVAILDAITGAELQRANAASDVASINSVNLDEPNRRLFVNEQLMGGFAPRVSVLDATTLTRIATSEGPAQTVVDHTQRIAINVVTTQTQQSGCTAIAVETWKDGSQPIARIRSDVGGACPFATVATPPDAPATLSRQIDGRRVTLTWSAVRGATDYQIEAGGAPGLANLVVVRTAGATQLTIDNVPAGTYHVRVRAINDVDASAPSSEIVVTVQ